MILFPAYSSQHFYDNHGWVKYCLIRGISFCRFLVHLTDFLVARTQLRLTGHDFDGEGKLREFNLSTLELTGTPFRFDAFNGDEKRNQERYEQVGNAVTAYIQALMKTPAYNMTKFNHFLYGSVSISTYTK